MLTSHAVQIKHFYLWPVLFKRFAISKSEDVAFNKHDLFITNSHYAEKVWSRYTWKQQQSDDAMLYLDDSPFIPYDTKSRDTITVANAPLSTMQFHAQMSAW